MSLLNAKIACQLWFLSSVRVMRGITESLWCCPLRAAVASAENLLGPWWRRRRRGVGGAGWSRGWSLGRKAHMWRGWCGVEEAGIGKKCRIKTLNAPLEQRLSNESRPSDCFMFRRGCSQVWVTITYPAHPKHPWLSDRMVKPTGPPRQWLYSINSTSP